ncbi:hypothetical protein, partial [Haematobacter missouriensis]|uniref:hypothetical protein n=1 Tax=Haematobacter missouriensis TaxID=366616 RepID=UPI001E2EEE03
LHRTDTILRAFRQSDGSHIHSDRFDDIRDDGIAITALTIKNALIAAHPRARGLTHDDIDVEISVVWDKHLSKRTSCPSRQEQT